MTTVEHAELVEVPQVVVGVDGSRPSVLALRWAAGYAAAVGATVAAVAVWQVSAGWGTAGLPLGWDPEVDAREMLDRAITEAFGEQIPMALTRTVVRGNASQVLLNASKSAVLLVVGSRGHGGFVGMLLGSVSAALAEHSACPVLVIHGDQQPLPLAGRSRSAAGC